jgi:hypothetical protein
MAVELLVSLPVEHADEVVGHVLPGATKVLGHLPLVLGLQRQYRVRRPDGTGTCWTSSGLSC